MKKVRTTPNKKNESPSSSSPTQTKKKGSFLPKLLLFAFLSFSIYLGYNYSSIHHTIPVRTSELSEQYFINKQGLGIFTEEFVSQNAKAAILFVHGYGEYAGRYKSIGENFQKEGISFYTLDLQGHGRSEGDRIHIEKFDDYVDEVIQYTHIIKKKLNNTPLFLMGNSMGGCISAFTGLREKFRGVILVSPMLKVKAEVAKPHLVMIASFISSLLPKLTIPGEKLDIHLLTHSKEGYESYVNSPYCYQGSFKANGAYQNLLATQRIQELAPKADYPFFILQSENDYAVDPEGSKSFYQNASSNDKKLHIYEGAYHHLLSEPSQFGGGAEKALSDIKEWITKRI